MRFPSLSQWMLRGRKVEDRGRGVTPSYLLPRPVSTDPFKDLTDQQLRELNRIVDEHYGLANCPECGDKVAVLIHGLCRDCGPDEAA